MCIDVIEGSFIGKLGSSPQCKLDDGMTKFIVQLDRGYTVVVGDEVLIKENIIQRKNRDAPICATTSDAFSNIMKTTLVQNDSPI